ncbi:LuxR C-terminal-related transcriptional regulator [Amycolatopsis sp. NPDC051758]|uniref:helix-turn-helix transcriptional regulator n=1 Tax=Amycolatopsis sp. NPDC051758 TaxID=3363935 RepID=UPI003793604F
MGVTAVTDAGPGDALAALDRVLTGPGAVWLVRGPAGAGRSTALSAMAQRGRRSGAAVLAVPAGAAPHTALVRLTTELVELITSLDRPELVSMLTAVAWLRSRLDSGAGPRPLPVAHDLVTILGTLAPYSRIVLQFDDFDLLPPDVAAVLALVAEGARAAGTVTVATTPAQGGEPAGRLLAVADGTIDLRPLTGAETTALLPDWTTPDGRRASDPGLVAALGTALGPLFGNPGTVRATVAELRARGRLVVVDDHVCLTGAGLPILLPENHSLPQRLHRLGRTARKLAAVVAVLGEHCTPAVDHLTGLAASAGLSLPVAGRVLDELVRADVLRIGADGAVEFAVPALADRLRLERDARWRRALHGGIARHLLAQRHAGAALEPAAIARHLAELPPSTLDTEAAHVLLDGAAAASGDSARRYRVTALRRLDPADERFPAALRSLLADSFATGVYGLLADDLATVVAPRLTGRGLAGGEAKTALVCWLAALAHEHRLLELDVVRPLADALGPAATRLVGAVRRADRTAAAAAAQDLAGADDDLFDLGAAVLFACLPGTAADEVSEAADLLDFPGVLESQLPGRYRAPSTGFTAGWHAVREAYRTGDWDTALSLARAVEGGRLWWESPRRHRFASVFAAEICAQRGEPDRAAAWLRRVPFPAVAAAYVAWVRCTLRRSAGHPGEAVELGWQEYVACRGQGVHAGAEFLLARLLRCARSVEDRTGTDRLLAELEDLAEHHPTLSARETLLVYGGLVREDPVAVRAGLDLARRAGDVFRVAEACVVLGELSPVPAPWLLEAHRTLKRLGATAAMVPVAELLDRRRITVPRDRTDRAALDPLERRIADLVASGRTNRQIAAALRISEKRVEARLTSLFERTGCHSRVELAAAWLQGRLGAAAIPA